MHAITWRRGAIYPYKRKSKKYICSHHTRASMVVSDRVCGGSDEIMRIKEMMICCLRKIYDFFILLLDESLNPLETMWIHNNFFDARPFLNYHGRLIYIHIRIPYPVPLEWLVYYR